jgi:hypothetical protein
LPPPLDDQVNRFVAADLDFAGLWSCEGSANPIFQPIPAALAFSLVDC